MPDITIDGTSITGLTIDGVDVTEVTIDGAVAWKAEQILIETGQVALTNTIAQGITASISFTEAFAQAPVVIAYVMTGNGMDSITARVRNITTTGCEVFFEENTRLDNNHTTEEIGWAAFLPGRYTVDGVTFEAGVHTTATTVASGSTSTAGDAVSFSSAFAATPVILHALNSYANAQWKATQANSVSTTGFNLSQEEGTDTGAVNATEDIGWVAIENVGAATMYGVPVEAKYANDGTNDGVTDTAHSISYAQTFSSAPDLVISQNTRTGTEGGWARGAPKTLSATSTSVYAEEDSYEEQGHADETFGWFAVEPNAVIRG